MTSENGRRALDTRDARQSSTEEAIPNGTSRKPFDFGVSTVDSDLAAHQPTEQRRIPECDYVYRLPDATEWFRRRRWRLEPPMPERTKDITYLWVRTPYDLRHEKRDGADKLLYCLPELLEAKEYGLDLWSTEGEKDCEALRRLGAAATTHHGGAGSFNVDQAEWMCGFGGVVRLLFDLDTDDPHGGNVGAYDVIRRYDLLRGVGLAPWQLLVGHAKIGKDAADHIEAGFGLRDFVWVEDLAELRAKASRTSRGSFRASGYTVPSNWGDKLRASNGAA